MSSPYMTARNPVAVNCGTEQLDVFFVGNDGNVYTANWSAGGTDWSGLNGWYYLGDGDFPFNGVVGGVSRNSEQIDVFITGYDHQVHTVGRTGDDWTNYSTWRGIGGIGEVSMEPLSPVSVVSRNSDQLDAFFCGQDGHVYTSWWNNVSGWSGLNGWEDIGGVFPAGAPVAAVSRNPMGLDLFICGTNGHVYTSSWNNVSGWSGLNGWEDIGGVFPAGAPVAAVSRNPMGLDLFICGTNGHVYTSSWNNVSGWSGLNGWEDIGGVFPAGAPVAAVSRNSMGLDLFICGTNGHVYTSWWNNVSGWSGLNGWEDIGGVFPAGAPVSAVSRNSMQLDLFIGGFDYNVYTSWWNGVSDWSGLNGWENIGGCVLPPPGGLISNVNYFFDNLGDNLTSLEVSVKLDADFVSADNGFSFQMNCWSPTAAEIKIHWQQYVISLPPNSTQLYAVVNNWTDWERKRDTLVINDWEPLGNPLPTAALKAGYLLEWVLEMDANPTSVDGSGHNVTAANFNVYDENWDLRSKRIPLIGLQRYDDPTKLVTTAELAPIVAFTFNIGGWANGLAATLTSGSGIITYSGFKMLQVNSQEPTFIGLRQGTAETANLVFGTLPPTYAEATMQEFHYVADHDRAIRENKGTHSLRPPDPAKTHPADPAPTV